MFIPLWFIYTLALCSTFFGLGRGFQSGWQNSGWLEFTVGTVLFAVWSIISMFTK